MMKEDEVIEHWKKSGTRKKALAANSRRQRYFFLDGPPYATGYIHMGTAFNKVLKDYYMRYFRMRGFDVWSQPGYDTHGLPIENKVEKQLGIKGKQEIEAFGIDKFNRACADYATKYIGVMNDQFNDLGVWMDWEKPYITLEKGYMEGAWHTFKIAYEKGLLYKGKYPVHVCPSCETVVAYNEIVYSKRKDTSVYVKFPLKQKDEYLLIWTTTPWTLPSNTGVMANPKHEYALVETMAGKLWMAKELVPTVMEKLESGFTILKTITGKEMDGWEYDHPMGLPLQQGVKSRVVMSERYVHLEEGTGLVHCAPGHGHEDWEVGMATGLAILSPVLPNGHYDNTVGKYSGMFVKDADRVIIDDLKASGHLLLALEFEHDYPDCWRCNSPLLFLNMPQWFFNITGMKDKLIKQNDAIPWVPQWAGKRFGNWLESLGDWPVSRQRYWGIPLPIWECAKCGEVRVVGSAEELGTDLPDLHRPFIDSVTLKCRCGNEMRRVPDVLDVWFDSGVAPWASLGYPKQKEPFESLWPVKFVLEGPDQTRGWWNSLSICGYITLGRIPFERILQHGLVLAEGGVKMSKSKGNTISPDDVVKKHSRDALRYYLLEFDPSEDFDFAWEKMKDVESFFTTLRNCMQFYKLYCKPAELRNPSPEDRWILSKVNSLIETATEHNEAFTGYRAVTAVSDFVLNDLSRWYIKLIRERTWPTYDGADKSEAYATLYYVLDRVNRLLAPALPFITEEFNLTLFGEESVHLAAWPEPEDQWLDADLEQDMALVRQIAEQAATLRQAAGVKLRWPLRTMTVSSDSQTTRALSSFSRVLKSQCNVKYVTLGTSIGLDTSLDDALLAEALASDVTRQVQTMRKKMGLQVADRILLFASGHPLLPRALPLVTAKVNAEEALVGEGGTEQAKLKFEDSEISIGVSKA